MPRMKKYPSAESVRLVMSDEEMEKRVSELSHYDHYTTIATYTGEITRDLLIAWGQFSDAVKMRYPEMTIDRDLSIKRAKDRKELEDLVVSREQQDRYSHPEKYPDITSDEIEEGP
jgi:hypothetical protein